MSTTFPVLTPNFNLLYEAIAEICRCYGVHELALFGSVLRPDFRPNSDVDFLVVFHEKSLGPWAEKLDRFERELSAAVGRRADVTTKESVEESWNYIRRQEILHSARTIYAER